MTEQNEKLKQPDWYTIKGASGYIINALSVLWGVGGLFAAMLCEFKGANELGDFLAGWFSPLAFFWLVRGYFLQMEELREQRKEIRLAREAHEEQAANSGRSIKLALLEKIPQEVEEFYSEVDFAKVDSLSEYLGIVDSFVDSRFEECERAVTNASICEDDAKAELRYCVDVNASMKRIFNAGYPHEDAHSIITRCLVSDERWQWLEGSILTELAISIYLLVKGCRSAEFSMLSYDLMLLGSGRYPIYELVLGTDSSKLLYALEDYKKHLDTMTPEN